MDGLILRISFSLPRNSDPTCRGAPDRRFSFHISHIYSAGGYHFGNMLCSGHIIPYICTRALLLLQYIYVRQLFGYFHVFFVQLLFPRKKIVSMRLKEPILKLSRKVGKLDNYFLNESG